MRKEDATEFQALLDKTCSLLSRGSYVPNTDDSAMFFRSLARFTMAQVRAAFEAHIADPQRGRYVPTPADILAQLSGMSADDGRPGPEEAWAVALRGNDEAETVVWTAEMAAAWGVAQPVLQVGDEVGARMAFREAYTGMVARSRAAGRPAEWLASLGHDQERRKHVIREAIDAGRLLEEDAVEMVPALAAPAAPLMIAGPGERPTTDRHRRRAEALAKLQQIGGTTRDALDWARDLQRREERGEDLPQASRDSWRAALQGPMARTDAVPGGFTPIPADSLPPGMRGGA